MSGYHKPRAVVCSLVGIILLVLGLSTFGRASNISTAAVVFSEPYLISGTSVFGPVFSLTKPTDTTFSWVNQGTGSIATTNGSVYLSSGPGTGAYNWRLRVASLPGATYTVTMGMRCLQQIATQMFCGLVLYDSGMGKLETFGLGFDVNRTGVYTWASVSSNTGAPFDNQANTGNWTYGGSITWIRIVEDGVNRTFYTSTDHINWNQVFQEASATFLTPNQIGFGVSQNVGSTGTTNMTVFSYLQTTP